MTAAQASGWFVGGFLFCAVLTGAVVLVAVRAALADRRRFEEEQAGQDDDA